MSVQVTPNGTRPSSAPRDRSPRARRALITFRELDGLVCAKIWKGDERLDSVEDEYGAALDHVPFVEWHVV